MHSSMLITSQIHALQSKHSALLKLLELTHRGQAQLQACGQLALFFAATSWGHDMKTTSKCACYGAEAHCHSHIPANFEMSVRQ